MEGMFLCLFTQRSIWLVENWTLSGNSRLTSPAIITNHLFENDVWHYHLMSLWAKQSFLSAPQPSVHITCTNLPPTFMGIQPTTAHANRGIKYSLIRNYFWFLCICRDMKEMDLWSGNNTLLFFAKLMLWFPLFEWAAWLVKQEHSGVLAKH